MIFYIYMRDEAKNNVEKLRSGGGMLSAKSVFIKATPILVYRLK